MKELPGGQLDCKCVIEVEEVRARTWLIEHSLQLSFVYIFVVSDFIHIRCNVNVCGYEEDIIDW